MTPLLTHHIRQSFSRAAPQYNAHSTVQRHAAMRVASLMQQWLRPDQRIADIGCGTGMVSQCAPTYTSLIHVDAATAMCQYAKQHNPHILCADGQHLPLHNNVLDGYIACFSWQWMRPASHTVHEMQRVLHAGGTAIIAMPLHGSLRALGSSLDALQLPATMPPLPSHTYMDMLFSSCNMRTVERTIYRPSIRHCDARTALHQLHAIGATASDAPPLSVAHMRALLAHLTMHHSEPDGSIINNYVIGEWVLQP